MTTIKDCTSEETTKKAKRQPETRRKYSHCTRLTEDLILHNIKDSDKLTQESQEPENFQTEHHHLSRAVESEQLAGRKPGLIQAALLPGPHRRGAQLVKEMARGFQFNQGGRKVSGKL